MNRHPIICLDEHDYFKDGWTYGERNMGNPRQILKCAHCGAIAIGNVMEFDQPTEITGGADENRG